MIAVGCWNAVKNLLMLVASFILFISQVSAATYYVMNAFMGTTGSGYNGDGIPATSAQLYSPEGLFVNSQGLTYLSDQENNRVRLVSSGTISTFSGTGTAQSTGDNGPVTQASVWRPCGIWGDSTGKIYFSEFGDYRVRKVSGGIISTYAGTGSVAPSTTSNGDGGSATSAPFKTVYNICGNSVGMLYIADNTGWKIRVVNANIMNTVVGNGNQGYNADSQAGTSTLLTSCVGVFADTQGNLYYTETGTGTSFIRVLSYTTNLVTTTLGTTSNTGFAPDGTPATSSYLDSPRSVWVDITGTLFFAESSYRKVRTVTSGALVTLGGSSPSSSSGDGGPATSASFVAVKVIYGDSSGNLVVSDDSAHNVRKMILTICPTIAPSVIPTLSPSVVPTLVPSQKPTTARPSVLPTVVPSLVPSLLPSQTPSLVPSNVPTLIPTAAPSVVPTLSPSAVPTVVPSQKPTVLPSLSPSCVPSATPSLSPSNVPTLVPTVTPTTVNPSVVPTVVPSLVPSLLPSQTPSLVPTHLPTVLPTVSPSTTNPTIVPTCIPSLEPTFAETLPPTLLPSIVPSEIPSTVPIIGPTVIPSNQPTRIPTVIPSIAPTDLPSRTPSVAPTVLPSVLPTVSPSALPSLDPTIGPSDMPSAGPSISPTLGPSEQPTMSPSSKPSVLPSVQPSVDPSATPTIVPTAVPTPAPSLEPTYIPTNLPSHPPTAVPSILPTTSPSANPSQLPSGMPISISPSTMPSQSPSTDPTLLPSVAPSFSPTYFPTIVPTLISTPSPSVEPSTRPSTSVPSLRPSENPTAAPINVPSCIPSATPSVIPTTDPSNTPSTPPSITPSVSPSSSPSIVPSGLPSCTPTILPSAVPSCRPTLSPSFAPSMFPTMHPSVVSTNAPSKCPTLIPTPLPSLNPTISSAPSISSFPTASRPTKCPTVMPSVKPTRLPSAGPSLKPTRKPSVKPSLAPTRPTVSPTTGFPTISMHPTESPSLSVPPSVEPSEAPTVYPTQAPTMRPTTESPSVVPTMDPTLIPSFTPSIDPSALPTSTSPTAAPSTVDFYVTHPKATLPGNASISVVGPSDVGFRVILPFLTMSSGPSGNVYTDIKFPSESFGNAFVVPGGVTLSTVNSVYSSGVLEYGGAAGFDTSKRSVSVLGDINGDSNRDLIIGDPFNARCYVLFGGSDGLVNMLKGFTIFGESEGDLTGWSVSGAGDFNNDTIADIIVGAPFANEVGAIYVIYGRRNNNYDVHLSNLTASQGMAVYGAKSSDYLGISVSNAGDFNGDKCDDVIAGAVMTSQYFAGAAFVIYGGSQRQTIIISTLSELDGFKLTGVSYSYTGYSVATAGDVNKDNLSDVVIGSCPQKSTLALTSYVIFGSYNAKSISVSTLTPDDGVRIVGGGLAVSFVGDFDHDLLDDVLLGANFNASSEFGYIVFSTVSYMTRVTIKPTIQPTRRPSLVPSRFPTVVLTRTPTLKPTALPSMEPSFQPSGPTFEPTPSVTQPSSRPTSHPTYPTIAPSVPPTESPTQYPSQEPSEPPTLKPSESPTECPSFRPTILPSTVPTLMKTCVPTSAMPTPELYSRSPFVAPTLAPTNASIPMTGSTLEITDDSAYSVFNNQTNAGIVYAVNTTRHVTIYNLLGYNTYVIVPRAGGYLTIVAMDKDTDKIDLSEFSQITSFEQLQIREGSVIITLPFAQTIHILNLHPVDMDKNNFVFYKDKERTSHGLNGTEKAIAIAAGVLGALIAGLLFCAMCIQSGFLDYILSEEKQLPKRLEMYTLRVVDGVDELDLLEKHQQQQCQQTGGVDYPPRTTTDEKSDDLSSLSSEYTINSDGEIIHL